MIQIFDFQQGSQTLSFFGLVNRPFLKQLFQKLKIEYLQVKETREPINEEWNIYFHLMQYKHTKPSYLLMIILTLS